ncbi:hypothetical protein MWU75_19225 [Ornithinimicrobium sp. F0845]|uniref:hypothetical protein n=1 Tax=Ornithinimicrobium sp. F0845 TaxID=2926412 RepID=UPI001FF65804|nr:hypothetical protein [Ornithinimicrobium sp. F0845]MCK0114276.1 hypothetical protein [Ornithinimicrobium sp. F0845]
MEIQDPGGLVVVVRAEEPLTWPEAMVSGTLELSGTRCLNLVTNDGERVGVVWPVDTVVNGATVVLTDGTVLEAGARITAVGGVLPDGVEGKLGGTPTCVAATYVVMADIAVVAGGQR